ncbi:MAG: hypothetical protein AMJ46_07585 [Latescibacteria bacterium DG_63]|uniref:Uncharacterized protein n=2 Tax=Bacteria division TA06 TaxID=1156500 RepID=A0A0S8JHV8_UNCT6|nr:MAG: hypothetical protein AMJ46_07585 [Latescibacteria bacterium DG_63]KPK69134.1 MAG: hypothetical protein AMJ82_06465 [candidate division TA06 bacterium SM23_40]KPL09256.1 MAG: hypothetical protein AMJ71_06890 [candidate division TA06 bacterium SM1_40]
MKGVFSPLLHGIGVVTLIVLLAQSTFAIVEYKDLTALTTEAERIVLGEVIEVESSWTPDHRTIYTSITVAVDEYIKNPDVADELTFRIPGGTVGDVTLTVSDTPWFGVGDRAVLFLTSEYAEMDLVGWHQGKATVDHANSVVEYGMSLDSFIERIEEILAAQK